MAVGAVYFLITSIQVKRTFDRHSREEAAANTNRIADSVKDSILNRDNFKLTQIVFDEKKPEFHIKYIALFDDQKNILAHNLIGSVFQSVLDFKGDPDELEISDAKFENQKILNIDKPVFIGIYKVGYLRVGYDFADAEKSSLYLLYFYGVIGAAAIFVLYFLGGRLAGFVVRPIEELTSVLAGFASGKFENRAKIRGSDEIGKLSSVFNQMADNLNAYQNSLQSEKEKLEQNLKELESARKAVVNLLEDSKGLEASLTEERDKFKTIIDSLGEGVIIIDQNAKIIMVNKMAENLLDAPDSYYLGKDYVAAVPRYENDKLLAPKERPLKKILEEGKNYRITLSDNNYYQAHSGKKFPIALIATPIRTQGLIGAIIVFRDISEEKKLDEAKTGFISLASHQMRTPLTTIRWYAEILKSGDLGKFNKEQTDFIDQIHDSTLKILETIKLLLSISRLQSGQMVNTPVKTNLKEFAEKLVAGLKPSTGDRDVKIIVPGETPAINIDQTILEQVMGNLINNALTYTENKGHVEVEVKSDKTRIICSVKDDGIGIPKEETDKIFDHFYRAPNAKAKRPDGNGLGLNLAKDLVKIWGGQIWFESPALWPLKKGEERHKGTVFYFTIPLAGKILPEAAEKVEEFAKTT